MLSRHTHHFTRHPPSPSNSTKKNFSLPYSSSAPAHLLIYGGTSSGSLRPRHSFFVSFIFLWYIPPFLTFHAPRSGEDYILGQVFIGRTHCLDRSLFISFAPTQSGVTTSWQLCMFPVHIFGRLHVSLCVRLCVSLCVRLLVGGTQMMCLR